MCALLIAPLPPSSHKQTLISLLQTARQRHHYLCSKQPNTDIAIPPRCRRQTTDCLPALCSHRQTTDCHACSMQPQTDHRLPSLLCAASDRPQIATSALCSLRQITDCLSCSVQPQRDHRPSTDREYHGDTGRSLKAVRAWDWECGVTEPIVPRFQRSLGVG